MANEEIASQVLDYWFAIEFLGQDSYDVCTEESKLVRALKTFKKADQSTKNKRRQISVFELVNSESDIYSQIVNQAKECDMTIWGNLTFYIGRVSRQACIEKLAQELGAKLEQEERNSEYIPILSFQCTTNGAYVEHSLSLSTVIWAISQVEGKQNGKLSDLLSSRAYSDTIEQLEREFFESDNFNEQEAIEEASVKVNSEGMPVFADDAIVASKIMSIHSEIVKMYGKFFPENVIEERNGFKYQLFKNSKAKDKYDDDNYMGLSHDFFSNDLKMVKESIEAGKDDFSTGMLSNLKKEEDNLSNFTTLYSEADFKLKESEKRMKDLSEQEISYKKQALDVENSVGFFTKIFRKSKYQSALDLAECFRLKAQECTIAVNQASHKIGVERAQVEKYRIDKDNALQRLHESKERLKKLEGNKSTTQMRILRLKGEINNAQVRAEAAKSECERDLREYLSAGDMKTGKVLDDTFIEDVLSKNDKVSTKAQISNPWSTEEFNREREKLFYLALQMTKEFVLSSKSCRTNLCILGQYWGFRTENDTDRIKFHKQDREAMTPSDGKVESFIYEKSQWINVTGVENGHGDHYVAEQGNVVCEMVNVSFQKAIKISKMQVDTKPSLYIMRKKIIKLS